MSTLEKSTSTNQGTSALPPGLALYYLAIGHYVSRALFVAAKLGLTDLLKDGPRDYRDLARDSQTHGPSLRRLMRLLVSANVLEELESGLFALKPLGELLRTDIPRLNAPGCAALCWFCLRELEGP